MKGVCASNTYKDVVYQDNDSLLWNDTAKVPTKELAQRKNQGKLQYSLLDLKMLAPCVSVLEFGAKKYERGGYKKGFPETQIIDSLVRHISAILAGEIIDPESGLPHIGHIQCNALFLGCNKNVKDLTGEPV